MIIFGGVRLKHSRVHVVKFFESLNSKIYIITFSKGIRDSVADWGTTLQVGRMQVLFPMRSLDISFELILPGEL
jgi:hypothetical protein